MPLNPDHDTCEGNLHNCPPNRGGCGYHYKKGEPRWQEGGKCPKCGFSRRCQNPPVAGKKVCWMHGVGSKKRGKPAGRPPKNGRIPERLAERILEKEGDPKLLEMNTEIAALLTRFEDLLARTDSNQSNAAWLLLQKAIPVHFDTLEKLWLEYDRSMTALKAENTPTHRDAVQKAIYNLGDYITDRSTRTHLTETIRDGTNSSLSWDEAANYAERIRKLKDSQRRWEMDKHYYVDIHEAMALPIFIHRLIGEMVADTDTKGRLLAAIEQYVLNFQQGRPTSQTIELPAEAIKILDSGEQKD